MQQKIPEKILIFVNEAHRGSKTRLRRIYEMLPKDQQHAPNGSGVPKQFMKGNGIGVFAMRLLVACCRSLLFYSQKVSKFSFLGKSKRIIERDGLKYI